MSNRKKRQFMTLYKPVHAQFERFCKARAYGEMDYKDLMQETITIAFDKFDSLRNQETFLHFLFGISIRVLSNANRKIHEQRWSDDFSYQHATSNTVEKKLEVEDLYKALGKIPELQREALILFEISGFSIKEIAVIQESSEDAVKKRLSRGRTELAMAFSQLNEIEKVKVS